MGHLTVERKDQERLERLKAERQEKINELKEKTNYYITQQLIQVIIFFWMLFLCVLSVVSTLPTHCRW
jgi:hypothetical protein